MSHPLNIISTAEEEKSGRNECRIEFKKGKKVSEKAAAKKKEGWGGGLYNNCH